MVETHFHLETSQLLSSADRLTGLCMLRHSNLSESFINNLCVKNCNSSNTLQFFHISPNNVNGILWKKNILHFYYLLFVFFVILLLISSTKFESIKLKCYIHPYLALRNCCEYALLRMFFKKGFSFNYMTEAGMFKSVSWRKRKFL